jgi:hypothetical protein
MRGKPAVGIWQAWRFEGELLSVSGSSGSGQFRVSLSPSNSPNVIRFGEGTPEFLLAMFDQVEYRLAGPKLTIRYTARPQVKGPIFSLTETVEVFKRKTP